jgi:hypothetical protein
MTQEIESVKPTISVIIDDGDFIINSTGPVGKAMAQAILPLAASAHKVTIISDGEMKVMKRNPANEAASVPAPPPAPQRRPSSPASPAQPSVPDIQEQFAADLEAGRTGEKATGEIPSPTLDPAKPLPPTRRKPQIFQDAAAPPAPELVEEEMDRLLAEAAQAEADASRVAEDRRFQAQQAVQAGQEAEVEPEAKPAPRKRERQLATSGRPCGRCGGGGQIVGDAGFAGACPVCLGAGQIKTWDRALKVR